MHKGSCLCGAVKYEVSGELPAPTACHCTQCRKHSGHYEASMGTLDTPSNTKLKMHVHVASKGDYYDLDDGLPQFQPPS